MNDIFNKQLSDIQGFNYLGGNLKTTYIKICKGGEDECSLSSLFDFRKEWKNRCCSPSQLPLGVQLDVLVEEYKNTGWCQLEACVSMLNSMLELIVGDVNEGKTHCIPPFKRSTHQYCMPCITVIEASKIFSLHEKELAKVTNFEDLRQTVYDIAEKHLPKNVSKRSDKNQFGQLACYDFCMRYGYHRMGNALHTEFNLYPDNVYLQAGSLLGAKALWKLYNLERKWLKRHEEIAGKPIFIPFVELERMDSYPKILLDLTPKTAHLHLSEEEKEVIRLKMPMHLENFFCIYHLHLKSLAGTLPKEEKDKHNKKINLI